MKIKCLYGKVFSLLLIISLGLPWISFAQIRALAPVAQMIELLGTVKITRNGRSLDASKNMDIMIGDEIKTAASSEACVKYTDGSLLFIREKSEISIQPLPGRPTVGRRIKIMVGKVWARIRPNKDYQTEFETPAAVAAIRGTVIETEVITVPGLGWRMVRIGCGDGQIALLYSEEGVDRETLLEKGKMALFRKGERLVLMGYAIGAIAGQGSLILSSNILPYLLLGTLGAGGAGAIYLIIRKDKLASPSQP